MINNIIEMLRAVGHNEQDIEVITEAVADGVYTLEDVQLYHDAMVDGDDDEAWHHGAYLGLA